MNSKKSEPKLLLWKTAKICFYKVLSGFVSFFCFITLVDLLVENANLVVATAPLFKFFSGCYWWAVLVGFLCLFVAVWSYCILTNYRCLKYRRQISNTAQTSVFIYIPAYVSAYLSFGKIENTTPFQTVTISILTIILVIFYLFQDLINQMFGEKMGEISLKQV